jgi:hypothetical protein
VPIELGDRQARLYRKGWTPGGQTITSKPLGAPDLVLPAIRPQPGGTGTQPMTVHAIKA